MAELLIALGQPIYRVLICFSKSEMGADQGRAIFKAAADHAPRFHFGIPREKVELARLAAAAVTVRLPILYRIVVSFTPRRPDLCAGIHCVMLDDLKACFCSRMCWVRFGDLLMFGCVCWYTKFDAR